MADILILIWAFILIGMKNDILYWMEYPRAMDENGHVYEEVKIVGNIYENPELEEKVYGEDKE